jgi:hypothetical protein
MGVDGRWGREQTRRGREAQCPSTPSVHAVWLVHERTLSHLATMLA